MTGREFLRHYDKYAEAIYRHCYYRVFDHERARDFAQETFLRAWQYLSAGRPIRQIRPFLYRVANNLIIDESRKKQTVSLDLLREEGFDPPNADDRQIQVHADVALVRRVMSRLNGDEAEVLIMRFVDQLKPKEIAEILGVTANVVSVRIHRALETLKKLLHS